jgi:hypothetical protein
MIGMSSIGRDPLYLYGGAGLAPVGNVKKLPNLFLEVRI